MARKPNRGGSEPRHAALDYRPPPVLRLIRYGLISIVAAAVLGVAYTAYWFFLASNLKDGIGQWIEARAGAGVQVSQKRIEISGFPLALRVIMTSPRIAFSGFSEAGEGDRWDWRADKLTAYMAPWNLNRISVDLAGEHALDIAAGRTRHSFQGQAGKLRVIAGLHGDELPASLQVSAAALRITTGRGAKFAAVAGAEIFAKRLFPSEVTAKTPTFDLDLRIRGMKLPAGLGLPLGADVRQLNLLAKILGRFEIPATVEALGRWRGDGGIIEVERLETQYGPLYVRANGTLALDAAMQPVGAMTAKARGFFEAVRALRGAGHIRSRDAAMARLILGALARKPKGGGPASISLPLSIQERKLYAGPVRLMDIPVIKWKRLPDTSGPQKLR
jgi:hypothetical protein